MFFSFPSFFRRSLFAIESVIVSLSYAYGASVGHLSLDILLDVFLYNVYNAVQWAEQAWSVVTQILN